MARRTVKPEPEQTRPYNNAGRAEQARLARRRVVDAARDLLLERGYAATTISEIARRAGVSPETVYKSFGSKAAIAKQVYDVMLVGDDEPVPLGDRPEVHAIAAEPDRARKLMRYAALSRTLSERVGPLLGILVGARSGDPELEALARTMNAERLAGTTVLVEHLAAAGGLRPGLSVERARDVIWALISPELYFLLVGERGWTADEYEAWLARSMVDGVLARD
jgi:AcrR family transcriptional regulator